MSIFDFQVMNRNGLETTLEEYRGCNGNLKALPMILDGWTVEQIEEKLSGITCGRRPTSCADQLTKAVRAAYNKSLEIAG